MFGIDQEGHCLRCQSLHALSVRKISRNFGSIFGANASEQGFGLQMELMTRLALLLKEKVEKVLKEAKKKVELAADDRKKRDV